jgi:large subunit ribosomal protein L22
MGSRKQDSAIARKEANKDVVKASLNNCPSSPRKMRLVADIIRGENVDKALYILKYSKKDASNKLEKLFFLLLLTGK